MISILLFLCSIGVCIYSLVSPGTIDLQFSLLFLLICIVNLSFQSKLNILIKVTREYLEKVDDIENYVFKNVSNDPNIIDKAAQLLSPDQVEMFTEQFEKKHGCDIKESKFYNDLINRSKFYFETAEISVEGLNEDGENESIVLLFSFDNMIDLIRGSKPYIKLADSNGLICRYSSDSEEMKISKIIVEKENGNTINLDRDEVNDLITKLKEMKATD